jgi:hypothetical protein
MRFPPFEAGLSTQPPEKTVASIRTCQLCGASFDVERVRCPLCGDTTDRETLKRCCIHCGKYLRGKELESAIDLGGWLTGELVCADCRRRPVGAAILYPP